MTARIEAFVKPIIVAVNKCDHPAANPMRVKQQLQDKGLVPDDWGGDTLYVECSALTKQGVDKLIESILLQSELLELKANHERKAKGNVIESGVEPGGPVATVLVRKGTLRVGDVVICGQFHGRVRAMMNDDGLRLKEAGPSCAVRVLGLNGVPEAGSEFSAVDNEKAARELAEEREEARKKSDLEGVRPRRRTLEDIFTNIDQMSAKILKVIVKADTQGSVEAICEALRKIETSVPKSASTAPSVPSPKAMSSSPPPRTPLSSASIPESTPAPPRPPSARPSRSSSTPSSTS